MELIENRSPRRRGKRVEDVGHRTYASHDVPVVKGRRCGFDASIPDGAARCRLGGDAFAARFRNRVHWEARLVLALSRREWIEPPRAPP